jgi:hypothetical protein
MRASFIRLAPALVLLLAACGASERTTETEHAGPDGGGGGGADGGGDDDDGCGVEGVDKVYVVTNDYDLLQFDPAALPASGSADGAFQVLGELDCPAGASLIDGEDWATPFSMSVDRHGDAWVLYSSGEIFKVSIDDASCQVTSFTPRQQGMDLFGMGFVTDTADGEDETLYIAGGAADSLGGGDLGTIDPETLAVAKIGELPGGSNPELTGTGAAELWGYFPSDGFDDPYVARFDRASAQTNEQHGLPSEGLSTPAAWAFAQHGGMFYIFVTMTGLGGDDPTVQRLDPATGGVVTYTTSRKIVGAGVSTCAPFEPVE